MKNIIFFLPILLIACTNNGSNPSFPAINENPDKYIEISQISNGDLNVGVNDDPLDLGVTNATVKELSKVISIKNTSSATKALSFSDLNDAFKIKVNRCPDNLEANTSCQIRVSFFSRGLYDGDKNDGFTIDLDGGQSAIVVHLKAKVTQQPDPIANGLWKLQLIVDYPFSPNSPVKFSKAVLQNVGQGVVSSIGFILDSHYGIRINRCGSSLRPGESCYISLYFKDRPADPTPGRMAAIVLGAPAAETGLTDSSYAECGGDISLQNSCQSYYSAGCTLVDGSFKIDIAGEQHVVNCDMTHNGGGWTQIAAGGGACTAFGQRSNNDQFLPILESTYGSDCGYLSDNVVSQIALNSSQVRLRMGSSLLSYDETVSNSGSSLAIASLRNHLGWHTNNAYSDFSSSPAFDWNVGACPPSMGTGWPNMYQACNNGLGVHWLGAPYNDSIGYGPTVFPYTQYTSTWIR